VLKGELVQIQSVLVANRGEIALRVMRACRELGIRSVAVYSDADRDALHTAYADEAYHLGPAPARDSYLSIERLLDVARRAGVDAIHPGYGFLAEHAGFAQAVHDAGFVFIGPTPEVMRRMGGKVAARREAAAAGVPIVPGTLAPLDDAEAARRIAQQLGFPVAIKAVAGGGGRGFRVVHDDAEFMRALDAAQREAASSFGDSAVYLETYLSDPRHIEIQVLADAHGTVVQLGERECSVQRRHQKLIEESPSPGIDAALRAAMGAAAVSLARTVGYVGVGTLEFMVQDGAWYFLEMNTRIQVEHPVTELVTGIDLVQAQIRVARGELLWFGQEHVVMRGHAIECRINAEDAGDGFRPVFGTVTRYREPAGFGVRLESAVAAGTVVAPHYDSLLAKLVVWAEDRAGAIARAQRALRDLVVDGLTTTRAFHQLALQHPAFVAGATTVNFIPRHLAAALASLPRGTPAAPAPPSPPAEELELEINGRRFQVTVRRPASGAAEAVRQRQAPRAGRIAPPQGAVVAALQGTVVALAVAPGQAVADGALLLVIEAMKMENEVLAPHAGIVEQVDVVVGQIVEPGMPLLRLREAPAA
jgi:acetyl-CoA/propionyl-CoA carboxylase biotin carboxyl carrier protein